VKLRILGSAVVLVLAFSVSPADQARDIKTSNQGQADVRLKGYQVATGLQLEIVAAEPIVQGPAAMTFAADGALYVVEWTPLPGGGKLTRDSVLFTFQDGTRRTVAVLTKPVKDRIKRLSDSKGKGSYDEAKVLLQADWPAGILVHDGWLYLAGRGKVDRYRLTDLGTEASKAIPVARGFAGFGRRQVSGLTIGNDGLLYITTGDKDNLVEGSDGSRANVRRSGAIFRCRPDGSKIESFAQGFFNPYGPVSFDAAGNLFQADSGGVGKFFADRRLLYVAEGNDFGWRHVAEGHARPGSLHPLLKTTPGSANGVLVYDDTALAANYRGLLFYPDAKGRQIRALRVEPHGAGFQVVEQVEIVKSSDPHFHPNQLAIGPDGFIYICDGRFDPDDADRLGGSKQGRIYRLRPATPKGDDELEGASRGRDCWAKLRKLAGDDLLKALTAPDLGYRQRAREELVWRARHKEAEAKKIVPALLKMVKDGQEPLPGRMTVVSALEVFWNADVAEAFVALLQEPNPDLRRLAAEGLGLYSKKGDRDIHEDLVQSLGDEDLAVRRAVIMAIARINAAGAADVLVNALQFDNGKDTQLRDGILRAIERVGRPAMDKLLALADSGIAKDRDVVVSAFLDFHSQSAAEALPRLLKNVHLTPAQRTALRSKISSTKETKGHEE
jgi:quinoprotein glucose dehydrogenase